MANTQCPRTHSASQKSPFVVDGVRPTAFQYWRKFFSFNSRVISTAETRDRYFNYFYEIFDDLHPVFLSKSKTRFERLPHLELGRTGQKSHHIAIDVKLKNHPLYPVIHAHELSHVYDLKIGRLSSFEKLPDEILDSEIRAHYRQLLAANKIFSKNDLIKLRDSEKDENLKAYMDVIIQYGDKPDQYIAFLLLITKYEQLVYEASAEPTLEGKARFLLSRINSVLKDQL